MRTTANRAYLASCFGTPPKSPVGELLLSARRYPPCLIKYIVANIPIILKIGFFCPKKLQSEFKSKNRPI